MYRLSEWIDTVSTKQNNMIRVGQREVHVEFIIVADWISLAGIFGEAWCYYCPCSTTNYNPNTTPKKSLLQILRKNIFICLFHSSKRIVETLLNRGLQLWTTLLEFQSWLAQLEIPFRDNKLTGSLDRSEDWVAIWQVVCVLVL